MKYFKSKLFSKKISWLYVVLFSLVFGLLFSFTSNHFFNKKQNEVTTNSAQNKQTPTVNSSNQPFINPILTCVGGLRELKPFKNKIQTIIDKAKLEGKAKEISVFFRSMRNGYLFGINRREKYYPASLLKVPVMMAYLKQAVITPGLMDQKVKFEKPFAGVPPNNVNGKIELGKEYTIKELIEKMVVVSDNDATLLLNERINPAIYSNTLKELGLSIPERALPSENFIGVEDFGRILRILYNSSYLNRELSNFALMLLSKAQYGDGIPSGTGSKEVAHKFGEWMYKGEFQLHDCGIVYDAEQPYMLCVMTKGKDIKVLSGVIAEISKAVSESVVNNNVPVMEE
ncbi:MAG: serine hydrolase [Bacteroidota bacterium]|nr:serine hydrolase [Bacteroidota bacterium]